MNFTAGIGLGRGGAHNVWPDDTCNVIYATHEIEHLPISVWQFYQENGQNVFTTAPKFLGNLHEFSSLSFLLFFRHTFRQPVLRDRSSQRFCERKSTLLCLLCKRARRVEYHRPFKAKLALSIRHEHVHFRMSRKNFFKLVND